MNEAAVAQRTFAEPPESPAEEQIITQQPASTAVHCVVFVGDFLTPEQKRSPLYRLGGHLFPYPDVMTVPNSIVRRCEVTRLKPVMRSVHKQNIQEDKWPLWTDSFTLTNQWDKKQQKFVNITFGVNGGQKDLVYKPLQPSQEIGMIAYRANDGVVHLSGEAQLNTAAEIKAAQLHYFPNWADILRGAAKLPLRISELEDHINDRMAQARTSQLVAVGEAFLYSCAQFRTHAKDYVDRQTGAIEETKGKGVAVRYDDVAENLFKMCDITREDKMVQNFASNQIDSANTNALLATAITKMTEILNRDANSVPNATPESQPPAPVTIEEAQAEMDRVADDEIFADMTAAVVPEVAEDGYDAINNRVDEAAYTLSEEATDDLAADIDVLNKA